MIKGLGGDVVVFVVVEATVPQYHSATVPQCHGTTVPQCHNENISQC